jgi:VWFA-related protein
MRWQERERKDRKARKALILATPARGKQPLRTAKKISRPFVFLMALASLVSAQTVEKNVDEVIKLNSQLVVVDVQALSHKTGRVINGLRKEEFTVFEDGVRQNIERFSQDRLPLSIVLLLDVSGSVYPIIEQVRQHGLSALEQLKPEDEVALMAFGQWATVLQDFTKERVAIINKIGFIETMGRWIREGTYIDEAMYQAALYSRKATNPDTRRCIIVVTDNLGNQPEGVAHSQREALEELRENGSVVSSLVVGDFAATVKEYQSRQLILDDLIGAYVNETGGVSLSATQSDASLKLAELIERLRTRYSLGYYSINQKQDKKFRKISVKLSPDITRREGKTDLINKKGYYAAKE